MQKLQIQDLKTGRPREVTPYAWDLMRTKDEHGEVRKGYKLVGPAPEKGLAKPAPVIKSTQPTFIPDEIQEAERARVKREADEAATMISGSAPAKEEAPAPEPVKEAPSAPEPVTLVQDSVPAAAPAPAPTPASVARTTDDLTKINGITAKVVEVLAAVGVRTFADLAAKAPNEINQALVKAQLAPKSAMVPNWKNKAGEFAKAPAQ